LAAVLPAIEHQSASPALALPLVHPQTVPARHPLRGLSLNAKLCLAASVCTLASLLVTGVAVGLQSSRVAEESARQSVRATGQYAASQVQSDL